MFDIKYKIKKRFGFVKFITTGFIIKVSNYAGRQIQLLLIVGPYLIQIQNSKFYKDLM